MLHKTEANWKFFSRIALNIEEQFYLNIEIKNKQILSLSKKHCYITFFSFFIFRNLTMLT